MSAARVASLRRYPVKSMDGAEAASLPVGPAGVPGDRAWCLRERATGKPASAKRHAALLLCRARYLGEPGRGLPPPPAEVELPDGTRARTDDPAAGALLSRFLDIEVAFECAPDGAGFFDSRPLHLISNSALKTMATASGADFDARRFRPNVVIDTEETGRPEDAWLGQEYRLGEVPVRFVKKVERCVMTTLPQPGLGADKAVFRDVFAAGGALGVYLEALAEGELRAGNALIPA